MPGYIKIPEQFIRIMQHPLCGLTETRIYLWLSFRTLTQGRRSFEASLSALANDCGLFVKSGKRVGRPDGPRVARALRNLERLGLITRKRKKTKAEGNLASKIALVANPRESVQPYPWTENSLNQNLPILSSAVKKALVSNTT